MIAGRLDHYRSSLPRLDTNMLPAPDAAARQDRLPRNDITTEVAMQRRTRTTAEPFDRIPYVWPYGMGAESPASGGTAAGLAALHGSAR